MPTQLYELSAGDTESHLNEIYDQIRTDLSHLDDSHLCWLVYNLINHPRELEDQALKDHGSEGLARHKRFVSALSTVALTKELHRRRVVAEMEGTSDELPRS